MLGSGRQLPDWTLPAGHSDAASAHCPLTASTLWFSLQLPACSARSLLYGECLPPALILTLYP